MKGIDATRIIQADGRLRVHADVNVNGFTPGQSGGPAWGWWGSEPWPRVVGVGSTSGSTAVQAPTGSTNGDNEYGGGSALSALISWARANYP